LKRFEISKFFDTVTPRDKVKLVKPNTEHLEATLRALHVAPGQTVFVGDGTRDMRCARELNVIAVGLPTGISSEKDLINSGANYLISSITELPKLVQTINKGTRNRKTKSSSQS
jgi:phosphoglycolate phosphatase-like HAD superfamily hydrolase